ncbi:hypothetical protein LIER_04557 [Lithospermum erythrorhizon]|uniref:Transposase n=1 Tax=Lithospermum erythrorhizon TaxID=34254 RepID=A0AAV3P1Y2_LITER
MVTQDISRAWMIEKVLPAIRDRWPMCSRGSTIYIQQDNARPHIKTFDEKLLEAAKTDGFDIRLTCQAPNSPELNVLDLGYFRAIQSLQYQEAPRNIDELVKVVEKSYKDLSPKALNHVFITLQECMI